MSGDDRTVCIASHDAGGAEILACYVKETGVTCRFVLEGPALTVFERQLGRVVPQPLGEALAASDWCLFGTSWQSDLEWRAIGEARRAGKRVVSFLDHWVNYPERFVRAGVQHLPDELWVGDEDAERLARKHFPAVPVTLVPNPYLSYVEREMARYRASLQDQRKAGAVVLFVCENISGHGRLRFGDERKWGYTEFEAIEYFFARIDDLGTEVDRVVLRPHPSDEPGKYSAIAAAHAPLAELSTGRPLLQEMAEADIVVGCESTALVAAVRAGKRVFCSVPPGGKVHFIHERRGIEMLRDYQPA